MSDKRRKFLKPQLYRYLKKRSQTRQLSDDTWVVPGSAYGPEAIDENTEKVLDWIAEADPSTSGKYSGWLLKLYKKRSIALPEDVAKLHEMLSRFSQISHHLPLELRDINHYKTDAELYRTLQQHDGAQSKRGKTRLAAAEGQRLVMRASGYEVWAISTPEAAASLLRDTNWCVKDPKYSEEYLAEGNLYLFIGDGDYIALVHHGEEHGTSVMDTADEPVESPLLEDLTPLIRRILPEAICECKKLAASQWCEVCEATSVCPECLGQCECEAVMADCCSRDCYSCKENKCPDCISACGSCDVIACGNCTYSCDECEKQICVSCVNTCGCDNNYCGNCFESCYGCGEGVCRSCAYTCKNCDNMGCVDCMGGCDVCSGNMCSDCIGVCPRCGNTACAEGCTESCFECGEDVCLGCLDSCSQCDASVCREDCAKTCSECEEIFCSGCESSKEGTCKPCAGEK